MKVALVYDRVNKWGGAERVLLAIHELYPQAPLYTSVYNRKKALWAKDFDVKTSFVQSLPTSSHELYATFMPLAFEGFNFDGYDLVISVTSEASKGIITKPGTMHVCYCLTPTRYLWSGYDEYFENPFLRFVSKPAISYLRHWDKIASHRPDYYLAISKEVKNRIKKYYGIESEVLYPPVNILENNKIGENKGKYFLIVSRLVPYKRIELAIGAFNKLKLPLKIVGTGYEQNGLRRLGGQNIEFLGNLTDEALVEYYRNCIALIFPGLEDFGLTILEAQSFGKPVIAYRGGGALETIIEGKTGEFFYPQSEDSLIKQIKEFREDKYNPLDCIEQAKKFSNEKFKTEFGNKIKDLFGKYNNL